MQYHKSDLKIRKKKCKFTVSRALSGKGRISAETRSRVMDYAQIFQIDTDTVGACQELTAVVDVDVRSYGMIAGNALPDLLETGEIERKRYIPHRILHF